jgi:hypothetical protein
MALLKGHRVEFCLQLGGEAIGCIGVHLVLRRILYFAVSCVSPFTRGSAKISVSCVMTYFGKALVLRHLFLPYSLPILFPFSV